MTIARHGVRSLTDGWTILHAGALGDLVLAIQLALRAGFARRCGVLHVISRTNPGDMTSCNPAILRRSIEGFGAHWLHGTDDDAPPLSLRSQLAERRILSFLGSAASRVHERLTRCGCATVLSIDPAENGSRRHILDQWQAQLELQGFLFPKCARNRNANVAISLPENLRRAGLRRFCDAGGAKGPPALIHPGSGGAAKCWPISNFKKVAERLRGAKTPVAWVIGPVELERWSPAVVDSLQRIAPLIRLDETSALIEMLSIGSCLVANDSGPGHLASLLGTRTISIFGSTDSVVWKPAGYSAVVFQGDTGDLERWGVAPEKVVETIAAAAAASQ